MAIYRLNREIKEEPIAQRLQNAINLGRKEALKEVLKWLDENFYTSDIECADRYLPEYVLNGDFESKEQMLQSFKERFNIE